MKVVFQKQIEVERPHPHRRVGKMSSSSAAAFLAISLGFIILGEIFAYMTVFVCLFVFF